jgi:hypothetical protein
MKLAVISAALSFAVFLGSAQAQAAAPTELAVTADWIEFPLGFTGAIGGSVYRIGIFVVDGKVVVCGAGQYTNFAFSRQLRRAMADASFTMNGRRILYNLGYFPIYSRADPLIGQVAQCRETGAAAEPNAVYNITFGSRHY